MLKHIMHLRVAIIVAFYNGNKYIEEQVKSIFSQTHKNIEIFIFDDKSQNPINKKQTNAGVDLTYLIFILLSWRKQNF